MSLNHYHRMQQAGNERALFGVALPRLQSGSLETGQKVMSPEEMRQAISAFLPDQGWVMYRDEVCFSATAPIREDMIEAEYCRARDSLSIRLISDNRYSVVTSIYTEAESNMAFSEQHFHVRNGALQEQYNTAVYRLWWQQETSEKHQGRWQPAVQQFAGFKKITNNGGAN
ncbi:MAG: hypothetical protein CSB48_13860 [Proteobacteria bacterium]|nr:MAG: hypothetical protein CSB48_13860 [Pseudomonadota bacterium]